MRTFTPILFFLIFGLAAAGFSQDIKLTARVNRNPVPLNEQFTYEVEVSGPLKSLPDVELPDLSGFALLGGPSVSSSYQIVNFDMSASKTYSVILMPRKKGTFRIPPATTKYKGKTIQSNAVNVTVSAAGAPPAQGRQKSNPGEVAQGGNLVFLKVIPSRRSAYINEEITLRYKIYFRTNINNNQIESLPQAVGCWVEDYPVPQRPRVYSEVVDGVQYNVAEIKKVAVFPSRTGKITISPMSMVVETVVRQQRSRRPRSLFDDFFSDPFGQMVKKRISSGAVEIMVKPLPEKGRPADFAGLVGDYRIHSSLDKNHVETNQAISYKIKLSGAGLLKSLNKLPVEFSPDFEVYEPKISESLNKTGAKITSNKEYEYIIIPRVEGTHKIKPFSLSYFDPARRRYKTLKVPEYIVDVARGKETAGSVVSGSVLSKEEVRLLGKDIRFIREDIPQFRLAGRLPHQAWSFFGFLCLPLVVLAGAVVYRRHLEKMSTNVQYARSRRANKVARSRLKSADQFRKKGEGAEFYGAVSRALLGYISDKTNQSAAGLLRNEVEKILKSAVTDETLRAEYLACLDEADLRRFAPGQTAADEMNNFYNRAEKVLVKLEKYF